VSDTPFPSDPKPDRPPLNISGCLLGVLLPLVAVFFIAEVTTNEGQDEENAEPKEPFSVMDTVRGLLGTAESSAEEAEETESPPLPVLDQVPLPSSPLQASAIVSPPEPKPKPIPDPPSGSSVTVLSKGMLESDRHVYDPNSKLGPTAIEFLRFCIDDKMTTLARKAFSRSADGSRVEWQLQLAELDENEAGEIVGGFALLYKLDASSQIQIIPVTANFQPEQESVLVTLRSESILGIGGDLKLSEDPQAGVHLENATLLDALTPEAPDETTGQSL